MLSGGKKGKYSLLAVKTQKALSFLMFTGGLERHFLEMGEE